MVGKHTVIGLLIFIQILALSPHLFESALTYDGGLYASLGQALYDGPSYTFNGKAGDVSPGFPLLIAPFFLLGEKGMYLVPLIASFVLVISSFLLLEKRFGTLLGFLGALLIFTNTMIYTYSAYVLRDLPAIAFVMLSYLLYEKTRESQTMPKIFLLGLSMSISFLIKYTSLIALLPVILHAFYKKEKWILIALSLGILLILPWSFWSYENHGTPFKEHAPGYLKSLSLDIDIGENVEALREFNSWFFPLLVPLFFIGVLIEVKDKGVNGLGSLYLLLFVFTFVVFLIWPVKSSRYLLPAVFPVVYFAISLLSRGPKSLVAPILVLFVFSQLLTGVHYIDIAKNKYDLLEDAGHWIRDNTPEDSRIMTQSFRQIAFYSKRRTDEIPKRHYAVLGYIKRYEITHILIDSYEKTTPDYINRIVMGQGYKEVARFKDGYGEVIIYEV